jgi:hypothetical protein
MSELITIPGVDLSSEGLTASDWQLVGGVYAQAIEAAKCPAVGDPVIQLGNVDPRFDGEPAIGQARNLRVAGSRLLCDFTGVPPWVSRQAFTPQGGWAYNVRCQIGHKHPYVLGAVRLHDVQPPVDVINSLDDVKQMLTASAGQPVDDEFAVLWPPRTQAEADRRTAIAAAARKPPDDDADYRSIFGDD